MQNKKQETNLKKKVTTIENMYYQEIKDIPILTKEEEQELFKRYEQGDLLAREKIIVSNLRLVRSLAAHYSLDNNHYMDLIQEGNLGLMKAMKYFDYRKGNKFSTLAERVIRQVMENYLLERSGYIKYTQYQTDFIRKVNRERRKFEQELFREPNTKELADRLKISETDLQNRLNRLYSIVQLDEHVYEDDDKIRLVDRMTNPNHSIENNSELLIEAEREILRKSLETLKPEEKYVIEEFYGLKNGEARSLESISKDLKVTRSRVGQIRQQAEKKLSVKRELKELRKDATWNGNEHVSYNIEYKEKGNTRK